MLILLFARQLRTNDPDRVWTAAGVELLVECLVVSALVVAVVW